MKTAKPGPDVTQYKSLNDAAKYISGLAKGTTEIWYTNRASGFEWRKGYDRLKESGLLPTLQTLKKNHVLLGKIKDKNLDRIFGNLQGDNWSPKGEAWDLISKSGADHTSMSVGDIIKIGNKLLLVDRAGFVNLSTGKKMAAVMSPEDYRVLLAGQPKVTATLWTKNGQVNRVDVKVVVEKKIAPAKDYTDAMSIVAAVAATFGAKVREYSHTASKTPQVDVSHAMGVVFISIYFRKPTDKRVIIDALLNSGVKSVRDD
jgi:hypothetical protein